MGTIQFDRKYGTEIWKITSSEFSISKNKEQYKINIWVESYYELIERNDETGDTPTSIEFVFPLKEIPTFKDKFVFIMPEFEDIKDDWEEDKDYYYNWYYYEHRDVENIQVEIDKTSNNNFKIRITGMVEDPTDGNTELDTKLTIEFETVLSHELNGYWAR